MIFTPDQLKGKLPRPMDCSSIEEEHFSMDKRPKLFFVLATLEESLHLVLEQLAETVTDCPGRLKAGLYHPSNTFVFSSCGGGGNTTLLQDVVFSDRRVQKHRNVAVIAKEGNSHRDRMAIYRYNIYKAKMVRSGTLVLLESGHSMSRQDLFRDFPMQVDTYKTVLKTIHNP